MEMKQQTNKPGPILTQEEKKENENAFPTTTDVYCTSHLNSHYTNYQPSGQQFISSSRITSPQAKHVWINLPIILSGPKFPTESKSRSASKLLVYPLELFNSFATSIKASPGKRRTEWSRNTVLLMSTQAAIKGTAQYSARAQSFGDAQSTSRLLPKQSNQ